MLKKKALNVAFWTWVVSAVYRLILQGGMQFVSADLRGTYGIQQVVALLIEIIVMVAIYKKYISFNWTDLVLGALGHVMIQLPMSMMLIENWLNQILLLFRFGSNSSDYNLGIMNHLTPLLILAVLLALVVLVYLQRGHLHEDHIGTLYVAGMVNALIQGTSFVTFSAGSLFYMYIQDPNASHLRNMLMLVGEQLFNALLAIGLVIALAKLLGLKSIGLKVTRIRYLAGYYLIFANLTGLILQVLLLVGKGASFFSDLDFINNISNFSIVSLLYAVVCICLGYFLVRKHEVIEVEVDCLGTEPSI